MEDPDGMPFSLFPHLVKLVERGKYNRTWKIVYEISLRIGEKSIWAENVSHSHCNVPLYIIYFRPSLHLLGFPGNYLWAAQGRDRKCTSTRSTTAFF